jgi:hypothetical protein
LHQTVCTVRERRLLRAWSGTRNELGLCASLRIWFLFGHITPCACGVRGARAACDGFRFTRKTAAPFDVFYWLQVTNFDVLFDSGAPGGAENIDVLFDSAPKGANHFDVWDLVFMRKWDLAGEFIGYPNIGNRRATGYRTKVPSRQRRRANVYEVGIPPPTSIHIYEIRPRADNHSFDLISDAFPYSPLWIGAQTQSAMQSAMRNFTAAHSML